MTKGNNTKGDNTAKGNNTSGGRSVEEPALKPGEITGSLDNYILTLQIGLDLKGRMGQKALVHFSVPVWTEVAPGYLFKGAIIKKGDTN